MISNPTFHYFELVPPEIFSRICSYIPPKEAAPILYVCKLFHSKTPQYINRSEYEKFNAILNHIITYITEPQVANYFTNLKQIDSFGNQKLQKVYTILESSQKHIEDKLAIYFSSDQITKIYESLLSQHTERCIPFCLKNLFLVSAIHAKRKNLKSKADEQEIWKIIWHYICYEEVDAARNMARELKLFQLPYTKDTYPCLEKLISMAENCHADWQFHKICDTIREIIPTHFPVDQRLQLINRLIAIALRCDNDQLFGTIWCTIIEVGPVNLPIDTISTLIDTLLTVAEKYHSDQLFAAIWKAIPRITCNASIDQKSLLIDQLLRVLLSMLETCASNAQCTISYAII